VSAPIAPEKSAQILERRAKGETLATIQRELGVSRGAVLRALARTPEKTRKADEFSRTAAALRPPRRAQFSPCWSLESIRSARDAQSRGDFAPAVRLARAMRTDDAAFIAYHNRIAPQSAIGATLVAGPGARGEAVAKKAARSVTAPRATLAGIVGTLADHGIAIGYVEHTENEEGTRIDMRLTEWPLEFVRWNASRETLEARTRDNGTVDIVHGDGNWIDFRKFDLDPWTQEACVLPGALVWASHSLALKDWNSTAKSHGQAKIIGELLEGFALANEDNTLTNEAQAFLTMLRDIVEGEAGAGLAPPNSKVQFLANGSNAWQVFSELVKGREKAFARIYLGTDAILGSVGGGPGIDIEALFAVASSKIQGDFLALEEGLRVGLYEPWTAINEGDSRLAPHVHYEMPDPDEKRRSELNAENMTRLMATIEDWKKQGMTITQEYVNELARYYSVPIIPQIAATAAAPFELAPTDFAGVVTVDEARSTRGLPAKGGDVGARYLNQHKLLLEAQAQIEIDKAKALAEAPPPVAPITTAPVPAAP
jgi:hypothetical protein